MRWLADEHFAGGGRLLQTRRDIDSVAGHEGLPGRAGNDTAGVHADPCRERDAIFALQFFVEELEGRAHVGGRAHRSKRVVFVHEGIPNTAITASPMNFSTVPPWRSIEALISSK